MRFLENLPWHSGSYMIVIFAILLAILGFFAIQKFFKVINIRYANDVVGNVLGVVGVLYAVLMGFIIIDVEQRFHEAHNSAEQEANYLGDLFRDAEAFPNEQRDLIRQNIRNYVKYIIENEWNKNNGKPDEQGVQLMNQIWKTYYNFVPTSEKENIWYSQSISRLNDLSNARLQRLYNSHESLDGLMWMLLIGGAVFVTTLLYFFKVEHWGLSLTMIAMLVGFIAFMLYLIFALDTVFTGEIRVHPEALEKISKLFDSWEK